MRTREDIGWQKYLGFVRAGVPSADEDYVWQCYSTGVSINRVLERLGSDIGAAAKVALHKTGVPKPVEEPARSVAAARKRLPRSVTKWSWTHVAVQTYTQQILSAVPDAPPTWIERLLAKRVPAWRAIEWARERSVLADQDPFDDRAFACPRDEDPLDDVKEIVRRGPHSA